MRKRYPFDYAVVRVVPRVERGEFVNAGVILFSSTAAYRDYLLNRLEPPRAWMENAADAQALSV